MNREELMDLFSEKIRELLARLPVDYEEVQEIRLRAEKPLLIRYGTENICDRRRETFRGGV